MAIERYKYRAMNKNGRQVKGVISAANELDLHNQLQGSGLELLQCSVLKEKKSVLGQIGMGKKIKMREIIQFFTHMNQMQSAGVPLLDSLSDIRDTTDHPQLRDIVSDVYKDVSEGSSLSEALAKHPRVFTNLHVSLVASGEETGDLTAVYTQLIKYLKWVDSMQAKVRKATRYPLFVTVFVIITIVVMMGVVVPQIVGFIQTEMNTKLPFYTKALIDTSDFVRAYWIQLLSTPVVLFVLYKVLRRVSDEFAYKADRAFLQMPVVGDLIRKINIARFSQTFGALYASGISVLKGLEAARMTVNNLALVEALESVQDQVQTGSSLSEAFKTSGEFPTLVTRMLKVGEESGNLRPTLDEVSEFYTSDVDESVQGLISMIEPGLTLILGSIILWIAAGVFGPIYESFQNISDLV
ncbi:MAG: type II secretion system F family protein [Alphaproteobacteria bacterium]|jgi:type IV pilus assembly protein PilC|nr:type II secretion system F family protein [Alphaproteobacteria bacterium]MDP7222433.1 type II secretion system F family protein [Alphaproteobacteria bacterium]